MRATAVPVIQRIGKNFNFLLLFQLTTLIIIITTTQTTTTTSAFSAIPYTSTVTRNRYHFNNSKSKNQNNGNNNDRRQNESQQRRNTRPLRLSARVGEQKGQNHDRQRRQRQQHDEMISVQFDELLRTVQLQEAVDHLRQNAHCIELTRERWNLIFEAIEDRTKQAEENYESNTRRLDESHRLASPEDFPLISRPRAEMTSMYSALQQLGELNLFGAMDCASGRIPAAGSHAVRPTMLEEITQDITLKALTPEPTNTSAYAGLALGILEIILSVGLHINFNSLVFATVFGAFLDQAFINGSISEGITRLLSPGLQTKILKHEAGHFLCAYLLGCPVEGCVLSAWDALFDERFGQTRQVTASTSFFDPNLSTEMNSPSRQVTRSSIDRYSIIVMAGIAAEAINYGRADGGGGDEMALVAFLSNLNGGKQVKWNNVTIRNQARWGALQAILILRYYRPCYEALVQALEQPDYTLGDCIYAIEKAGRDNRLGPLREPLGYIIEKPGNVEIWTTDKPGSAQEQQQSSSSSTNNNNDNDNDNDDNNSPESSMEALQEYKKIMEEKLQDIETRLGDI